MPSLSFQPLVPGWLATFIVAALVVATLQGVVVLARRGVGRSWVYVLTFLRLAAAGVFALILLQPVASLTRAEVASPQAIVLVDVSRSMGDRHEVAKAVEQSPLQNAFEGRYALAWYAFDGTARRIENGNVSQLTPSGEATRLDEGLKAAYSHAVACGTRPSRVVLVSDGHDQSAEDPVAIAQRLNVKVDVLPTSTTAGKVPARIFIADVQGAHRVLLGSDTQLRVRAARSRLDVSAPAQLLVREDGREVLRREVKFAPREYEALIEVAHQPSTAGSKVYEFAIAGGPATAEPRPPYRHAVHVVDAKQEVLVLEDTWRWEYRYLHRLLEDDPSFRFTAFLARGQGTYLQLGSPDRQVSLTGLPQDDADLAGFDLIMLGDIDPQQMSDKLVQAIRSAVADEGKSLVVIAGPRLGRIATMPELHQLLPVELSPQSGQPLAGPIAVRWPIEARESPLFDQFEFPAEELPPLDQIYPAVRRRAGATVLLEAATERNAYGPQIVIAEQAFGHGRVLFIGTDTLWKWHTLAPDGPGPTPHSLFWQQTLRALSPSRSTRGDTQLWLTADRTRGDVGHRVSLRLEATSPRLPTETRVEAIVTTPDGQRVPLVFSTDEVRRNFWHTTFTPLVPGEHRVVATLFSDKSQPLAVSQQIVEVDSSVSETEEKGVDLAALARLASATGGQLIDPNDRSTWPKEATEPPRVEKTRSYALWENFSLLIALSLLLGADWLIRAVRGLT